MFPTASSTQKGSKICVFVHFDENTFFYFSHHKIHEIHKKTQTYDRFSLKTIIKQYFMFYVSLQQCMISITYVSTCDGICGLLNYIQSTIPHPLPSIYFYYIYHSSYYSQNNPFQTVPKDTTLGHSSVLKKIPIPSQTLW